MRLRRAASYVEKNVVEQLLDPGIGAENLINDAASDIKVQILE